MAQLSDDRSPRQLVRDAAYYARLRDTLNAPIQAIPAGVGSLAPEGQPALPAWVQAKLDEQKRQQAQEDALRRLAAVTQPSITPAPSTKRLKTFEPAPKPTPTPGFTPTPTPALPPVPTPTPALPVDRAFQRGTPEYNARLREILDGRTQGIAPGYGSIASTDELAAPRVFSPPPPSQSGPRRERLFDRLRTSDDEELAASRISSPAPPKQPTLREILSGTADDEFVPLPGTTPSPTQQPTPPPRPPGLSPQDEALFEAMLADGWIFEDGAVGTPALDSAYQKILRDRRIDQARFDEEFAERSLIPLPDEDDNSGVNPLAWGVEFGFDLGKKGFHLGLEGAKRGVELGAGAGHDAIGVGDDAYGFVSNVARDTFDLGLNTSRATLDLVEQASALAVNEAPRYLTNRVQDASDALIHIVHNPQLFSNYGEWNQALGLTIAAGSACENRRTADDGRVIYENCRGLARTFLDETNQDAFTVGSFIFVAGTLPKQLEYEELAHVDQYDRFGGSFLPLYFAANAIYGYQGNPFERQAKSIARQRMSKP